MAVVDRVVLRRGAREVATEYLKYLYSPAAQEIIARNFYRPIDAAVAAKYEQTFPKLELATIQEFDGWGRRKRCTSPTAACSTRFTRRSNPTLS